MTNEERVEKMELSDVCRAADAIHDSFIRKQLEDEGSELLDVIYDLDLQREVMNRLRREYMKDHYITIVETKGKN